MEKKAYIFRGAPASGKGTITELFVKKLKQKVALLELDMFRWDIHLTNREIIDVSLNEHQFAYQNFLTMLENYCQNGQYNIVMEGSFAWNQDNPHGNTQDLIKILDKHNFNSKIFLLHAPFEILWERNTKRKYTVPEHEFKELFDNVESEKGKEEILIDVSQKTVNQVLDEVLSII